MGEPAGSLPTKSFVLLTLVAVACTALYLARHPHILPQQLRRLADQPPCQDQRAAAAVAAAVTASAAVHGFVRKEGVADVRSWIPNRRAFRQARLEAWREQHEAALAEGEVAPPLPLMALTSCQVFVNHLYKVIYIRHPKSASSSILCHFNGCRRHGAAPIDVTDDPLSFQELHGVAHRMSEEELSKMWRDYLVVSFVRNPYQRAVSLYRMVLRAVQQGGALHRGYRWDTFCADAGGFGDECMQDPKCKQRGGKRYTYTHLQPQLDCMLTEGGGWALDYIGRVEHLREDLQEVLDELERRRAPDVPPIRPVASGFEVVNAHSCNASETERLARIGMASAREQYCRPEQYYQGRHAACFAHMQRQYASDVRQLGFGPPDTASM